MTTTDTAQKLCVHCKRDCASRPRTKDAQGRYMCRECVDALKAKAAAPTSAPPRPAPTPRATPVASEDEGSVLSTLLSDSPDPCPGCAAPLAKGAVVCSFCGFNKATGEGTRTRVLAAPKEKKAKVPGQGSGITLEPMWTGIIAIGLQVALFVGCLVSPAMVLPLAGVVLVVALACAIAMIVYCIKDQNIGWLIASFFIPLAGLYYVFAVSERGHLKALTLAATIGSLLFGGAMASLGSTLDDGSGPPSRAHSRVRSPSDN